MLDHDFGHLSFGWRIQMSWHSDSGCFNNVGASSILTWVSADTASAACPAHHGDICPMTFAAVICDATEPCSVNTAYEPESSFTMSPRSTTLPLVLLILRFQLRILEMTEIHQWRKVNFSAPFFLASSITSFLLLTYVRCHAGIFSSFFLFSTAAFASGFFF